MASSSTLYEVLGISCGASYPEIKSAYRRLARIYHPDVISFNRKEKSDDQFIKIQAAYSILSDPNKRQDYDQTLYRPKFSSQRSYVAAAASGVMSGFRCSRNWETDQCW